MSVCPTYLLTRGQAGPFKKANKNELPTLTPATAPPSPNTEPPSRRPDPYHLSQKLKYQDFSIL